MLEHNKKMQEFLAHHGIKAVPKYFFKGSMKGTWRIYGKGQDWYNNNNLRDKMTEIGFVDFDNEPLREFSGNGGTFQVFVRHPLTAGILKATFKIGDNVITKYGQRFTILKLRRDCKTAIVKAAIDGREGLILLNELVKN